MYWYTICTTYVVKFKINTHNIIFLLCIAGDPTSNGARKLSLNYRACFSFVEIVAKAILFIFGIFTRSINFCSFIELFTKTCVYVTFTWFCMSSGLNLARKVREKKTKHKWSILIMNELLQDSTMYLFSQGKSSFPSDYIFGDTYACKI